MNADSWWPTEVVGGVVSCRQAGASVILPAMRWSVYIIRACDGSLYTGVSTDVARRFAEHRSGRRGAKFFHGRKPVAVVYVEAGHSRSSACRREAVIKRLDRTAKLALLASADPVMLKAVENGPEARGSGAD